MEERCKKMEGTEEEVGKLRTKGKRKTMDAKIEDGGNCLGLGKCGVEIIIGEKGGEKQSLTPDPLEDLFSKHGLRSCKEFVLSFMSFLQEKLVLRGLHMIPTRKKWSNPPWKIHPW